MGRISVTIGTNENLNAEKAIYSATHAICSRTWGVCLVRTNRLNIREYI